MFERHDLDVGAARLVQRCDDLAQTLQVFGVIGDHQAVVAGVGIDRVVGADQRPQHGDQIIGVLEIDLENLRDDLVAALLGGSYHHRAGLQFGVGLRDQLQHAGVLDHGEAQAAQGCEIAQISLIHTQWLFAVQSDLSLDPRVDDDLAVEHHADRTCHRFDVGVDEIQRHRRA